MNYYAQFAKDLSLTEAKIVSRPRFADPAPNALKQGLRIFDELVIIIGQMFGMRINSVDLLTDCWYE